VRIGSDERGDVELAEDLVGLAEGDGLMFSVTHEVKIGMETSWIKLGATTQLRPGETTQSAFTRLEGLVNEAGMRAVEATVNKVRGYEDQMKKEMVRR